MEYQISVLLSGIAVGGQYALIAIGYTMVYGILRLINFAHGDVFMVAGLLGIYLSSSFPLYISLPLVIVLTVLLGFTIERVAYKPLRSAPRMSVMISAIGVSYLLQNTATYVTGGQPMTYPTIAFLARTVTIAGTPTKLVVILTPFLVALLVVILTFIINHTKVGMAMRAVSKDFETSRLMGIKINSVISATFVIGSFLAAVGSVLYFTNYPAVTPTAGSLPGLKAFVAAVFGGIGSIPGAVIGAFIIGICENIIKSTNYTIFSDAFTFALLIVILVFKPTGLFGEKALADKKIFNEFYANEFDRAKTVCGHTPVAAELIRKLRAAGIKVVLASNPVFPETAQKKRMQWAGVDPDDFEYITTYENSHYCKPNTKYYAELLEKLGYKAEDCIMVGNDVNEDMCAAEIGIKTFLLTDCMLNAEGKDISSYDRGGFPELEEYLMQHCDI